MTVFEIHSKIDCPNKQDFDQTFMQLVQTVKSYWVFLKLLRVAIAQG